MGFKEQPILGSASRTELIIGARPVRKADISQWLSAHRRLAELSETTHIPIKDYFWISHKEVTSIASPGHEFYINNINGMHKELETGIVKVLMADFYDKYNWWNRVYISNQAIDKALRGDGPLCLHVEVRGYSFARCLDVWPDSLKIDLTARVTIIQTPKERAVRGALRE